MRQRNSMPPQMGVPFPNLLDIPMQANQQAQANWQQQMANRPPRLGPPNEFDQMLQEKIQQTGIPDALQSASYRLNNAWNQTGIPGAVWGMKQDAMRGLQGSNAGALISKFFGG
jgi:hypothetical protein